MKKIKAEIKIEFTINESALRGFMRQNDYLDGEYDESDINDMLISLPEEALLEMCAEVPALDVEVKEYDDVN